MDRSSPSSSSLSFALSWRRWRGSGRSRAVGELVDGDCGLNSSGKPVNFMFHIKTDDKKHSILDDNGSV